MRNPGGHRRIQIDMMQVAVLEERMNTKQAEYKTDIAQLAAQIERRDKENTRWVLAVGVAMVLIVIAVVKL